MRKEISQKRKHWNIDKLARGKISRTRDNSQGSNENAIDYHASRSLNVNSDESSEMDVNNKKSSQRKAFVVRVKTKNLNLDDGFKWLKYGEKELRNHRYTRSYYKCEKSRVRRCPVQKWITVSSENSDYVDFAYIGIHNHRPNC
ncbi:hypothetical protein KP509_31G018400 [Ceratopteris richardii]|nr:hypothetical protein KP509_31G018400 [Ceratopteris richardii]